MDRGTARFVHLSVGAAGATGLLWAFFRYAIGPGPEPEDPALALGWSGVHPAEPALRAWHVVLSPLLVFALGLIARGHVWRKLRTGERSRRRTGTMLAAGVIPMVVSGYLLQVAASSGARRLWLVVHLASGGAWVALYALHQIARTRPRRPPASEEGAPPPDTAGTEG